jgi:hypothetical protein
VARGRILQALLGRVLLEFHERGLQSWSASCLADNRDIRRLVERLGAQVTQVTYQGRVADIPCRILRTPGDA